MNHQVAWVSLSAAGAPKSAGIFFTVLEKPRYIFGWFYDHNGSVTPQSQHTIDFLSLMY